MIKDADFRDDPWNPDYVEGSRTSAGCTPSTAPISPRCSRSRRRCAVCSRSTGERLLIGEIYLPVERLVAYYGADLGAVHLPFNFNLMWAPWQPAAIMQLIGSYERCCRRAAGRAGCSATTTRSASRSRRSGAGARGHDAAAHAARRATLYYGDELGLENVPIPPGRAARSVRHPTAGHGPGPGRCARRCHGTGLQQAASPRASPGCRSARACALQRRCRSRTRLHARADPRPARSQAARARAPRSGTGGRSPSPASAGLRRTFEQRRVFVVLNLDAVPKTVRFEAAPSGRIESRPTRGVRTITSAIA